MNEKDSILLGIAVNHHEKSSEIGKEASNLEKKLPKNGLLTVRVLLISLGTLRPHWRSTKTVRQIGDGKENQDRKDKESR